MSGTHKIKSMEVIVFIGIISFLHRWRLSFYVLSSIPLKYGLAVPFAQKSIHSRLDNVLDEREGHLLVVIQRDTFELLHLLAIERYNYLFILHLVSTSQLLFGKLC